MMNVTIIGGGYVGLVTGTCLSSLGHNVTIVETIPEKVDKINSGHSPIYEEGLDELLQQHIGKNLTASTSYDAVKESDVIFIAVGTPPKEDGSANLCYIQSAAEMIASALRENHAAYPIIVVKSTVPPTTTQNVVSTIIHAKCPGLKFGCCMNPEFLREGKAVSDFLNPDRIVIGSTEEKTISIMRELYAKLASPTITVSSTSAEMIKYTSNALLATKISFSNEIGNLCKKLGIDVYEVMKGVGLDHRITPHFLNAGAGFGGSCFPKDVSALASIARSYGVEPTLLESVLEVNARQPLQMIAILERRFETLEGKRIAVLGLAFKDNTDDIRESRSIPVIEQLLLKKAVPVLYDPMATENMMQLFPHLEYSSNAASALQGADGCLIMTEWPEFAALDTEFTLMKSRVIVDGRHILNISDAEGVCW